MEWEKFKPVVDQLTHKEDITLTGWGEPFLHPMIFEMIAYCKKRGHSVSITSNGLFTRPDMVNQILNSGVDALTFSFDCIEGEGDDGHASEQVSPPLSESIGYVSVSKTHLRDHETRHDLESRLLHEK